MEKVMVTTRTNVRGTMNTLRAYASVTFGQNEANCSYIRHTASILKRDTGKEFTVNYQKGIGTKVTRIA